MTTATENVQELRRQAGRLAPDSLDRLDLLGFRAMFLQTLSLVEALTTQLEGKPMATATLDKLDQEPIIESDLDRLLEESQQKAEADYQQLTLEMAEGKRSTKLAALQNFLSAAGRTIADLKRHLGLARQRRAAAEDLETADELDAKLPDLKERRDAAFYAYRDLQEKQRRELEPLIEAHKQSVIAYKTCRAEARELRYEATNLLTRTVNPEWRAEHDRLSSVAVKLQQAVAESRLEDGKARGRLPELETEIAKLEIELPRLDAGKTEDCKRAAEHTRQQVAELQKQVDAISKGDALASVIAKHEAAREALAKHESLYSDWRNMSFD